MAHGYLPWRGHQGRCDIQTFHPSLCFFVAYSLGFEIYSSWTSSTEYASDMDSIFNRTWYVTHFKHAKGVVIIMGDIAPLSYYPHYWMSYFVPHLLIGNIYRPDQLAQVWTCHQAVFFHSDSGGSNNWKRSLFLLTPPEILLHPFPYVEIPNQPWNPILASLNPVTSEFTKIQPAQPDNPEAQVYVSMDEVGPCGLFHARHIGKRVRVPSVYNYPPWVIRKLTINELDKLWDFPLLLQEKSEKLDKKYLLVQFLSSVPGKTFLLASGYLIISRIQGG